MGVFEIRVGADLGNICEDLLHKDVYVLKRLCTGPLSTVASIIAVSGLLPQRCIHMLPCLFHSSVPSFYPCLRDPKRPANDMPVKSWILKSVDSSAPASIHGIRNGMHTQKKKVKRCFVTNQGRPPCLESMIQFSIAHLGFAQEIRENGLKLCNYCERHYKTQHCGESMIKAIMLRQIVFL